jgi:hypothetical protein
MSKRREGLKTPKYLSHLRCDALNSAPIDFDWREAFGDDGDGWRSWEAQACDECGALLVLGPGEGDTRHTDVDLTSTCEGSVSAAEGPMMNYYYPVPLRGAPESAARKLAHLPLCVVEVGGSYGLALTGGGMDLSWEICEAFMLLGYLPPVHFASGLPMMGGRGYVARDRRIIGACEHALRVASRNVLWGLESLRRLRRWARDQHDDERARRALP